VNPLFVTTTQAVDPVFIFIFGVSALLLLGITATMVGFAIRYRRSRAPEPTSQAAGNIWLEIVWTALPTLLVLAMFYYGWAGYLALRNVPKDALPVTATARMWSWSFTYADGRTSPKLYVPVGKPVVVNLVSVDVLHGFYLPAFRVKRDVVPGMKNHVWFVADKAGSYDIFCSQYCGLEHSSMITTVEALPAAEFADWLKRPASGEADHPGKELLEKHGCLGCHSLDGTKKAGPTFKGIWGRQVRVLTGGTERVVTVDGEYLRRSIREPNADLVKGFPPIMPSFAALLTDAEIATMVDALRTSAAAAPKLDGAKLAREKGCLGCHSIDGSRGVGPTFKGLYQSQTTVLQKGRRLTVTVDDAYLRESVVAPGAMVVEGFQPVMPAYPDLTRDEVEALVEYIEGIR